MGAVGWLDVRNARHNIVVSCLLCCLLCGQEYDAAQPGQVGDVWYVVMSEWWRLWTAYVGFVPPTTGVLQPKHRDGADAGNAHVTCAPSLFLWVNGAVVRSE